MYSGCIYLITVYFSSDIYIIVGCYLLQVRCFAYAGLPVWVADLFARPDRSFDLGA